MSKGSEKVTKQLKEQVISKLLAPDCFVSDLSRSYLYKWRHKAKKKGAAPTPPACQEKFVELLVEEQDNYLHEPKLANAAHFHHKKTALIYP